MTHSDTWGPSKALEVSTGFTANDTNFHKNPVWHLLAPELGHVVWVLLRQNAMEICSALHVLSTWQVQFNPYNPWYRCYYNFTERNSRVKTFFRKLCICYVAEPRFESRLLHKVGTIIAISFHECTRQATAEEADMKAGPQLTTLTGHFPFSLIPLSTETDVWTLMCLLFITLCWLTLLRQTKGKNLLSWSMKDC